ncbi:ABC transporter permease [Xinfangfangia sp. CPCC 101601]|uniref:ABC transporter permease n=1 Tax=Pseudogemmobacter lacusdianii TaxID=3069608 RepID=A0ABU0VVX5_9RHOB|nr:ABC transporter permease [Xinfangfangia sp. CPCC 101601]MDQ2065896.1 ABC transporter permease [Xinfangfangia sp. CPCC 101601]
MRAEFWRIRIARILTGLVLAYLLAPLLVILPMSLTSGSNLTLPGPGWSWRWYELVLSDPRWLDALGNSLIVGLGSTLLAVLLATPAAVALAWGKFPGRQFALALIATPLVLPIVILAVASFSFYASAGLLGSRLGLILAHAGLSAPVVLITILASLRGFDLGLMRAAASLGAPPLTAFRRVLLPLVAPGVLAGAIIAFVISFDEVVIASYLTTAEQRTLPRVIFSGLRESISPAIAAAAVLLILASTLLLCLAAALQRPKDR